MVLCLATSAVLLASAMAETAALAQPDPAASPGRAANGQRMVAKPNPARIQLRVLALVNKNRRRGGCGNLTLDRRLSVAASGHASDMAHRGYFAHRSRNGEGVGDRVHDAGYRWLRYGENIARGQGSVRSVVSGWMHSRPHRANIMNCKLHQMGLGRAFDGRGTPYWVQDFASVR
jgi:uncharacterized protein YkwD